MKPIDYYSWGVQAKLNRDQRIHTTEEARWVLHWNRLWNQLRRATQVYGKEDV